jgi:hypothetical protein
LALHVPTSVTKGKTMKDRMIRVGLTTMKQPGVRKEGGGDASKVGEITEIMRQGGKAPGAKSQAGNLSTIMKQPAANRKSK